MIILRHLEDELWFLLERSYRASDVSQFAPVGSDPWRAHVEMFARDLAEALFKMGEAKWAKAPKKRKGRP